MKVTIKKGIAKGTIKVPPSKSYVHRALIMGMLAKSNTTISNISYSNDILATLNAIMMLGSDVAINDDTISFNGFVNIDDIPTLDANESGSTLRFLIPVSMVLYDHFIIKGTEKLFSRGLGIYEDIFKSQNITYKLDSTSLEVFNKLKPGTFTVRGNVSSQYITGLLMALPLLEQDSVIKIIPPLESKPYIDITLDVLRKFKINVDVDDNYQTIKIKGNQTYYPINYEVEGDYSNAAFLDAFNYFSGKVVLNGLTENSCQGDKVYKEYFEKLNEGFATIDLSNAIDLGPVLFVFASLKFGAHFINTSRLQIKESNRVLDLIEELKKINTETKVFENEVYIYKAQNIHPVIFDSHNDHRILMALTLVTTIAGGEIENAEAVNKSYPNFYDDISKLGIEVIKCDKN